MHWWGWVCSWKANGLESRIITINLKVLYNHCAYHRLSLCVSYSCSLQQIKSVVLKIELISISFSFSRNRSQKVERQIRIHSPTSSREKLMNISRIRLVAEVDEMNVFYGLFVPTVYTLEEISINLNNKYNREVSASARSLLKFDRWSEFVISLAILRNVLDYL